MSQPVNRSAGRDHHGRLSPEAVDRAQRSITAAPVFAEHAEVIAAQTPDLPSDDVLVAVVDPDYTFSGTWIVSRTEMVERVPELEGGGWAMVFSHRSDADQVRHRAGEMSSLAAKRIEMIARVRAKEQFRAAGPAAAPPLAPEGDGTGAVVDTSAERTGDQRSGGALTPDEDDPS